MSKVISLGQILFLDLPYEITVDNKISTAAQEDLQLYQFGASVSHLWCLSVSPLVPHCLIYYHLFISITIIQQGSISEQ